MTDEVTFEKRFRRRVLLMSIIGRKVHCRIALLLLLSFSWVQAGTISFQFTVPAETTTSAGIYDSGDHLVRTIWSRIRFLSGAHNGQWDGRSDNGDMMPDGKYTVRILCNDVHYVWEGVIGNTSGTFTGDSIWHSGTNGIEGLAISGSVALAAMGFNEGGPQIRRFSTASPQTSSAFKGNTLGADFRFVAVDDRRVYAASVGMSVWNVRNYTFLTAYDLPSHAPYAFPAAIKNPSSTVVFDPHWEHPEHPDNRFANCIDVAQKISVPLQFDPAFVKQHAATGLAVQMSGKWLAVAHSPLNQVSIFDKKTGNFSVNLSVKNAGRLTFTGSGELCVISGTEILIYSETDGRWKLADKVKAFGSPMALCASLTDDNLLLVADSKVQQFFLYDCRNQKVRLTLGLRGGYSSLNGSLVTNNKFLVGIPMAFQPDGSFWVYDQALSRLMHFKTDGSFQEQIMYHLNGATAVDLNDPVRLFQGLLEYQIDYSQPLLPGDPNQATGNGSWKIVRNWAAAIPQQFADGGFNTVVDLHGHTFALIQDAADQRGGNALVELQRSGAVRDTGLRFPNTYNNGSGTSFSLYGNGDLRHAEVMDDQTAKGRQNIFNQSLVGLDRAGNPIWSKSVRIASMPATDIDPANGRTTPGLYAPWQLPITSANVVGVMSAASLHGGMALGGVKVETQPASTWKWKSSPCVWDDIPMDGRGSFEIGDGERTLSYPSSKLMSLGRSFIYNYNGEFWNESQANQFMHFYDDGLFVGQFSPSGDILSMDGVSMPGKAGNNSSPTMIRHGADAYLYGNDESAHGGIQRWRFPGIDSIYELQGEGLLAADPAMIKTSISTIPAAPFALRATTGNGSVRLSWQGAPLAPSFAVKQSDVLSGPFQTVDAGLQNRDLTVSNLENGKMHYFIVAAQNKDRRETGTSEEVACYPFDPASAVQSIGGAAFNSRSAYRFDVVTENLSDGAFPLTLHTMFDLLGTNPKDSLLRTNLGSEGFVVFNFDTKKHADRAEIPGRSGITVTRGSGWTNNDLWAGTKFKLDRDEGACSSLAVDMNQPDKTGIINIRTPNPNIWHVLSVFLPDTFSQPRHYVLTAQSVDRPEQSAVVDVHENLQYAFNDGSFRIRGMNHIHQFCFRGNITLKLKQLPTADPQADNGNLQAIFFDQLPAF